MPASEDEGEGAVRAAWMLLSFSVSLCLFMSRATLPCSDSMSLDGERKRKRERKDARALRSFKT